MDVDDNDDVAPRGHPGVAPLYRLGSNQSNASVFEDVEMAHDGLFSGPVAESLPTSVSAFSHRRQRADSTASFTYYDEEADALDTEQQYVEDGAIPFDVDDIPFEPGQDADEATDSEIETGSAQGYAMHRRRSSTQSRSSVHARLLRTDSTGTDASSRAHGRISQKLHIVSEDLTIVIAGFRTGRIGYLVYILLCLLTLGLAYLLLRWLPEWQVKLIGEPCPLRECQWVVLENQWGEMVILNIKRQPYERPLSTVFGAPEKMFAQLLEDDGDPIMNELQTLEYRYVRFFFHPLKDKFLVCNGWKDPSWTNVRTLRTGIDGDEKEERERVFGANMIDIEQKSIPQLLVDEVFHPFYVFQIASLVLWSLDQYYYYAICIFVMSAGSIIATLVETRATMRRLRDISRFECDVRVLRNGFWANVSSTDLVPGDVYEISDPSLTQFPSDSILLSGDCIVNESMLTGESVPVSKIPATDETLEIMNLGASTITPEAARHFLFCGTKIIRARRPHDDRDDEAVALAMVVRTGFNTTKGSLVRSMLFPKPSGFKFYRDSFRYISVMGCIALLGFVVSFVNFVRLGLAWHLIIVRALDLITIVVPPALPATLTIGTNFALSRLKKKQIFCISPQRVNVGGKLDVMCFDKTGTLTEDGLDVLGVRLVSRSTKRFNDVVSKASVLVPHSSLASGPGDKYDINRAALFTMATCHSLRSIDGELVGDPLDLKMFEFTGWLFEEGVQRGGDQEDDEHGGLSPSIARPPPAPLYDTDEYANINGTNVPLELGVLRSFEFVSQLRRASVIVRGFGQQQGDIYVKGAPECMRDICRPESFPDDYEELLSYYTHKGYRVIACATKHLKKLSWVKSQKMKREEVEADLEFVGFIIFENKLKPTTAAVLKELNQSNIGSIMVTGDNILTAISVARNCGLVERSAHCFVPRFAEGDSRDPNARLQWESIDDTAYHLDPRTLLPLPVPTERDASLPYDITNLKNYSLAISGDVFRWIIDFAPNDVMQKMLVRGKIFARMSPDEKHELVEKLQSIGYCCGFCGDGANDCGALKAADVGISLSEAEASVAAPFTSRVFDIRCVPDVISREGRAALVTSFSCFKYMSLYSAIQFTSVSFLYASASNLGDFQFLFIDVLLILPIAIFMGWSGPYPVLSKKRPTANLVSRKVLTPLLGQMIVCILIQAASFLIVQQQEWYIPPHVNPEKSNIKNSENTALFLVSCFEYVFIGVVLSAGKPFRQPMTQNYPFMTTIVLALAIVTYMVFAPAHWLRKLMQLTRISASFKVTLLVLGVVFLILAWIGENYVFQPLARAIGRTKHSLTKTTKQRKEYKIISERMQS
ncbi:hypothetical protein FHL15_003668 [Xylaria flabelliformis]|uniref:Cation-transporting ATPase n=1 Tax=Xylaria flabelliformis TaxID=2512241 RepID=A0A553I565_9PEZI|nr:hypothetical protein FHL15_003668 [Xylaria flabelliformis]